MTPAQATEAREMYAEKTGPGWTVRGIARYFGVSMATVNKALAGKYDEKVDHGKTQ